MAGDFWSVESTHLPGLGRLCFRRAGKGPHLVLLHGLLGSGAQWQACAGELTRRFTCWALELPGISWSEAGADLTLPGLRHWLEQAVRGLGLERFGLIGSSWGGALGLEFAASSELRARLQRMILVAPAHPYWTPARRQRWLLAPPWTRLAAWCGVRLPLAAQRDLLARMYGDRARLAAGSLASYRASLCRPGLGRAVTGYARDWRGDQDRLRGALAEVAVPTLLVWGDRDQVVPAHTSKALCQALPHAESVVLATLGHLPFEEDPAAFCQAIASFLRAPPVS